MRAARFHRADWRLCRSVAACRARAAIQSTARYRRGDDARRRRPGGARPHGGIPATAPGTRLERRPRRADRISVGRRRRRSQSQECHRPSRARPRGHSGDRHSDTAAAAASLAHRADHIRAITDPVGAGLVESLLHPGGNATGFTLADYTITGKWLELLKETAPNLKHVAFFRDSATTAGSGQWGASEAFAPSFGLELRPIDAAVDAEFERTIAKLADGGNAGIIVSNSASAIVRRDVIIALVARYRLPAIYAERLFADAGGLISYGSNSIEPYRRAASYVARILKGEKPADLPVQNPTKYELIINLKTAKALGLEMPGHL